MMTSYKFKKKDLNTIKKSYKKLVNFIFATGAGM